MAVTSSVLCQTEAVSVVEKTCMQACLIHAFLGGKAPVHAGYSSGGRASAERA